MPGVRTVVRGPERLVAIARIKVIKVPILIGRVIPKRKNFHFGERIGEVPVGERLVPKERILEEEILPLGVLLRRVKVTVSAYLRQVFRDAERRRGAERSARVFGIVDHGIALHVRERKVEIAAVAMTRKRPRRLHGRGPGGVPRKRVTVPERRTDRELRHVGIADALAVPDESAKVERTVEIGVRDPGQFDRGVVSPVGGVYRVSVGSDRGMDDGRLVGQAARGFVGRRFDRFRADHSDLGIVERPDREHEAQIGPGVAYVGARERLIPEILDLTLVRRNGEGQQDRQSQNKEEQNGERKRFLHGFFSLPGGARRLDRIVIRLSL